MSQPLVITETVADATDLALHTPATTTTPPVAGHTKEPATRQDMSNVHMFLNALARAWRPAQYASHEVGGRVVRSPNAVTLVSTRLPSRRVKPHISQVGSPSLGTTPHTRR